MIYWDMHEILLTTPSGNQRWQCELSPVFFVRFSIGKFIILKWGIVQQTMFDYMRMTRISR